MTGETLAWAVWIGAGYLVGSIPVGYLLARSKGIDIRDHGSGNIGATNVWRVLGRRTGAICFFLDVLKGFLPVLTAGLLLTADGATDTGAAQSWAWIGVASATILGHMYPVWLRLRGGKGVATGLGAMLGLYPVFTVAASGALATWIISARLTRYVGVSSCIAAASLPLWTVAWAAVSAARDDTESIGQRLASLWPYLAVSVLLAGLVIWKHRGNVTRTFAGTEPRIGSHRA